MKSGATVRILKLAVAEILLQGGFDKATEQALNVLTDVLRYYVERLSIRMKEKYPKGAVPEEICRGFICDVYRECEYQVPELFSFLQYQLGVRNHLSDRYNVGCEESMLHMLRILPKNMQLKAFLRGNRSLSDINEIYENFSEEPVVFDEFMKEFSRSGLSEESRREEGEYRLEFTDMVDYRLRKTMRMNEREFGRMLEARCEEAGSLRGPESIVARFSQWSEWHVFKDG